MGTGLDPSHLLEGTTDKVGIDATKPLGEDAKGFEKARIPGFENVDLNKFFPNMNLGGRR
jgi:2,5-furandicarboxylate decarboxylase 1